MNQLVPALVLPLLLYGCASQPKYIPVDDYQRPPPLAAQSTAEPLIALLYQQHREWQGTPYRYGGNGRDGIDCSGFTQRTYRERLGIGLPRTTDQQARSGADVAPAQLAPGDLVFFRSGFNKQHVGIYVEQGRFLHASTSRGVTLSDLDSPYWRRHFWKAVRPRAVQAVSQR